MRYLSILLILCAFIGAKVPEVTVTDAEGERFLYLGGLQKLACLVTDYQVQVGKFRSSTPEVIGVFKALNITKRVKRLKKRRLKFKRARKALSPDARGKKLRLTKKIRNTTKRLLELPIAEDECLLFLGTFLEEGGSEESSSSSSALSSSSLGQSSSFSHSSEGSSSSASSDSSSSSGSSQGSSGSSSSSGGGSEQGAAQLEQGSGSPGEQIALGLNLTEYSISNPSGVDLELQFDDRALEFVGFDLGPIVSGWHQVAAEVPGEFRVALYSAESLTSTGSLGTARFLIKPGAAPGFYPVSINELRVNEIGLALVSGGVEIQ